MSFITDLETAFNKNRNPENAIPIAKYMKNLFSLYVIKTQGLQDTLNFPSLPLKA